MAVGTVLPPPPGRRVPGTRTRRAGSEGRGGLRQRGKSGGRRRAVCRAMDNGCRSLRRSGSHCYAGEILVDLVWNPVRKSDRSRMNIAFTLADAKFGGEFPKGAEARGMVQLEGHRAVGGMRASIYNAMPIEV